MLESNYVKGSCPRCDGPIEIDASYAGEIVQCPHCLMETAILVPKSKTASVSSITPPLPPSRLDQPPSGLECPFCHSKTAFNRVTRWPPSKLVLFWISLLCVWICIGVPLLIIALILPDDVKYRCPNCKKEF